MYQCWFVSGWFVFDQCNMFGVVNCIVEYDQFERIVLLVGKFVFQLVFNEMIIVVVIGDQVFDCFDFQFVQLGKSDQVWQLCYCVIFIYDFVDYVGGVSIGQVCDIYGGFGMFCLYKNIVILCNQWEDMFWCCNVISIFGWVCGNFDCVCLVVCGNFCGYFFMCFD